MNWCFDCGSALAEAEVEYEDRDDIAVDVAFPLDDADRDKLAAAFALDALPAGPVLAVIWTTTPWTLPANQALNVHPDFVYALVATERGHLVLAQDLVEACLARFKLQGQIVATAKGAALELIRFRHPLYDRAAPVYLGSYVTLEQGTGIVHSSPAYGVEDFQSCRRYGMTDDEILNPVGGDGRFAGSLPFFGGEKIWEANPQIVAKLRERGALLSAEKFTHSYMHCWRHRTPVIYRATTQWFAGMDDVPGWNGRKPERTLRETALAGIEATQFFPAWGKARLYGMIASRPDWTLSRQRQWGVPMPFFTHKETGALHPRTLELLEEVAQRVEKGGIEAWQTLDVRDLSADDLGDYVKIKDTLDVWFDSGSHAPDGDGRPGQRAHGQRVAPARHALSRGSLSRRLGPASRLVPFVAARVVHAERQAAVQGAADAWLRRGRRGQEDVEVEGQRRRAAEGVEHAGRGNPAAVGRLDRLFGRALHLGRDPEARRRGLPPHSQHAALPAREHVRFRSRRRTPSRSASCWRSTATRWPRRGRSPTRSRATTRATSSTWRCSGCRRSAPRTSAASISTC